MTATDHTDAGAPEAPVPLRTPNTFEDAAGRTIRVRTLGVLEQMKLIRLIGKENNRYFNLCLTASRVASIDDEMFPVPESMDVFEYIVGRLGDGGFAALNAFLDTAGDAESDRKTAKEVQAAAEAARDQDRALVRKLVEYPGFVTCVGLITSGVPADLVFGAREWRVGLDHVELQAWTIAAGLAEGHEWSWEAWRWRPPETQP